MERNLSTIELNSLVKREKWKQVAVLKNSLAVRTFLQHLGTGNDRYVQVLPNSMYQIVDISIINTLLSQGKSLSVIVYHTDDKNQKQVNNLDLIKEQIQNIPVSCLNTKKLWQVYRLHRLGICCKNNRH